MVFLVISGFALLGSLEGLMQLSRLEESALRVPSTSNGSSEALGLAVARMHTGIPPETPYTCRTRLRSSDGEQVLKFAVTHTLLVDGRWSVSVTPSSAEMDDCPMSFADACPLGGE
jgi:hypothetical protein